MTVTSSTTTTTTPVRPGQLWAATDPRHRGRTLRVQEIVGDKALCVVVSNTDRLQAAVNAGAPGRADMRGRFTRIRLDRLRPNRTGYRLVKDAEP